MGLSCAGPYRHDPTIRVSCVPFTRQGFGALQIAVVNQLLRVTSDTALGIAVGLYAEPQKLAYADYGGGAWPVLMVRIVHAF